MAVTESDLDRNVREMRITLNACSENEMSRRSCSLNVTDRYESIFDVSNRDRVLDITIRRKISRFCMGAICGYIYGLKQVLN